MIQSMGLKPDDLGMNPRTTLLLEEFSNHSVPGFPRL